MRGRLAVGVFVSILGLTTSIGIASADHNAWSCTTYVGTGGADTINGNDNCNDIHGEDGSDILRGYGDQDDLYGSGGADHLMGGGADDEVRGGDGGWDWQIRDLLEGNDNADQVLDQGFGGDHDSGCGNAGADNHEFQEGEHGLDSIAGGDGTDTANWDISGSESWSEVGGCGF